MSSSSVPTNITTQSNTTPTPAPTCSIHTYPDCSRAMVEVCVPLNTCIFVQADEGSGFGCMRIRLCDP